MLTRWEGVNNAKNFADIIPGSFLTSALVAASGIARRCPNLIRNTSALRPQSYLTCAAADQLSRHASSRLPAEVS